MNKSIKKIIIVGGGTAGWLTAGILAAEYSSSELEIVLVESPDVKTIGVGEGTWPSLRETLQQIGISEFEFIRETNASFKQASQFIDWRDATDNDVYFHPFSLPQGYFDNNLAAYWQSELSQIDFADAFSPQAQLCKHGRAPKQLTTPEYAAVANYAYHLDAGKFSQLLQKHCINRLGVKHILDHVDGVVSSEDGDIAALKGKLHGDLQADLFVDCTGQKCLLLGQHFKVPFLSQKHFLFNDKAVAVHVPYQDEQQEIPSATLSTAKEAGWVWDIALSNRRGVGYVYSSSHSSQEQAEQIIRNYVAPSLGEKSAESLSVKSLSFEPGYREKFWHRNCVAIGMSAGFIEPLEASAIALVELSAKMLRDQLPVDREQMDVTAQRFNLQFTYRWERVIDFLKLHYVLSERRDTDYWQDNQHQDGIPDRLQELLSVWKTHPPSIHDLVQAQEIFPTASYQYVLYGMNFKSRLRGSRNANQFKQAELHYKQNVKLSNQYLQGLPSNRELLNHIQKN